MEELHQDLHGTFFSLQLIGPECASVVLAPAPFGRHPGPDFSVRRRENGNS